MKKREHLENTAEQEALAAQLGESDTFIDKMKRMAADNKLAVFSAFCHSVISAACCIHF